jgi:hypothetical protein
LILSNRFAIVSLVASPPLLFNVAGKCPIERQSEKAERNVVGGVVLLFLAVRALGPPAKRIQAVFRQGDGPRKKKEHGCGKRGDKIAKTRSW